MEGIHILEVIPAAEPVNVIFVMFVCTFVCAVIGFVGAIINDMDIRVGTIAIIVFAVLGGVLGIIVGNNANNNLRPVTYAVTVDDDISLNEFYEHYEIIERKGKMFVVKEN